MRAAASPLLLLSNMSYSTPSRSLLRSASLQPTTLQLYNSNLQKFLAFTGLSLRSLLRRKSRSVDRRLAAFIDSEHESGRSFTYSSHALNALVFYAPHLKSKLVESRLRLRGWHRLRESVSHPPITWEMTAIIAVRLAQEGAVAEGVACLLAFDCFLRVGELVGLRYSDIVQPRDARLGSAYSRMALRLAQTKTGRNQWVDVENPQVEAVVMRFLRSRQWRPTDRVFAFSASRFRHFLRRAACHLGLESLGYVPHSFRHGGATRAYLRGARMEDIVHRGRWRQLESARRYIQTGRALLALQAIPSSLFADASVIAGEIDAAMATYMPPPCVRPILKTAAGATAAAAHKHVRFA